MFMFVSIAGNIKRYNCTTTEKLTFTCFTTKVQQLLLFLFEHEKILVKASIITNNKNNSYRLLVRVLLVKQH